MSLFIASLNSGSNGNCYYVGNDTDAVLVDAGISCREMEKRMRRIGLSMDKVRAVFISHEHSDHIRGLETMSRKHKLPVYITRATLGNSPLVLEEGLVKLFSGSDSIHICGLEVRPFFKQHDAADPYSFLIEYKDTKVGVFTDLGVSCENLVQHFSQCHAAFLEANYDEDMLEHGRYPYFLKKRIRGGHGHLSNRQALELFTTHKPAHMSHLLLSHLSRDNNDPQLVKELFSRHAGNTFVAVASRDVESEVFHVNGGLGKPVVKAKVSAASQISLGL